jgi:glycosyltransferase involved in cell wall biosynthesis
MKIKINLSVVGRFHILDLALQLKKYGILNKLITTYPKFFTKKWGIPNSLVKSNFLLELLNRFNQFFLKNRSALFFNFIHTTIMKSHAKISANILNECNIFIGCSSSSLEALLMAKELNKISILERGSPHILFQIKNIKKNNKINKLKKNFVINNSHLKRDLMEYKLADYIFLPSNFCKKSFIKYGVNKKKLVVNPYGVDTKIFKPQIKKDKIFRIIFSGGGSFRKGYHLLFKAFHELNLNNCEVWHLGNLDEEVKYLLKNKAKNWILKGSISQDKLSNYYSQGSVIILPSTDEGLSLVILQAMACGLPAICTPNTGAEGVIKNYKEGFIIPPRRINILKEKILFLYKNPIICKKMGMNARKRILNNFTWEHYGSRYYKNLKKILGDNKLL